MFADAVTIVPTRTRLLTRLSRPRSQGLCLGVCLIALVAAAKAIVIDNIDLDCWWHLRVAEQLLVEGIHPLTDKLSFASIQSPWTPYSWLAELGMKAAWDIGGFRAALLSSALMQAAFVLAIAAACRTARAADSERARFLPPAGGADDFERRPPRLCAALATAFATFISVPYLGFRPVTAALVILAGCNWLLVRDRRLAERSGLVWLIVPASALAVNLHLYAAFIPMWVAALLLGSICERYFVAELAEQREAERRSVRYVLLLGGTITGCMFTPMLGGVVAVALHYHYRDPMVASGFIAEMRPFFYGRTGEVSGVTVLLAMACIIIRRRRLRPGEQFWLVLSIILLSRLGRFAPVFALATAPQLAVTLPRLSDVPLGKPLVRLALAILLGFGIFRLYGVFPSRSTSFQNWIERHGDAPALPDRAAEYVRGHIPRATGRLICEFSWGGYLEWRLGDRYQTLLDGRTQLFTPDFWQVTYLGGDDLRRRFLANIHADAAILPAGPVGSRSIFRRALVSLGWKPLYRDNCSEVLVPPPPTASRTNDASFAGTIRELLNP